MAYPIPVVGEDPYARLLNFVWYRNVAAGPDIDELMTGKDRVRRPYSLQPVQQKYVDEMRTASRELAPPLEALVRGTRRPFLQAIVDLESPRMAFGRVALVGDGAFVARPHAAAGTAKAAEKGWKLAES